MGFISEIVEDCRAAISPRVDTYDTEIILSWLLGDPVERLVKLVVESRVVDYECHCIDEYTSGHIKDHGHESQSLTAATTSPGTLSTTLGQVASEDNAATSSSASPPSTRRSLSSLLTTGNEDDDQPPQSPKQQSHPPNDKEVKRQMCKHTIINERIAPFYHPNKISGNVSIYHGCMVKSDALEDLPSKLKGFIRTGVSIERANIMFVYCLGG